MLGGLGAKLIVVENGAAFLRCELPLYVSARKAALRCEIGARDAARFEGITGAIDTGFGVKVKVAAKIIEYRASDVR